MKRTLPWIALGLAIIALAITIGLLAQSSSVGTGAFVPGRQDLGNCYLNDGEVFLARFSECDSYTSQPHWAQFCLVDQDENETSDCYTNPELEVDDSLTNQSSQTIGDCYTTTINASPEYKADGQLSLEECSNIDYVEERNGETWFAWCAPAGSAYGSSSCTFNITGGIVWEQGECSLEDGSVVQESFPVCVTTHDATPRWVGFCSELAGCIENPDYSLAPQ
jgi:hypothetical protein